VELFSCRLYRREVGGLDLEIFHFVYDNTGPGSMLREIFAHIASSYGNSDIFARMMEDMPPVFHSDYAAVKADEAQKLGKQIKIVSWDLTGFLLPEVVVTNGRDSTPVKTDAEQDYKNNERHDSPAEERETKRKRSEP
jgi:hypothetical protein